MRPLLLVLVLAASASAQGVRPRLVGQIGHSAGIEATAFSPDGRHVLTGGEDRTARVWDAETGAELARLVGHAEGVFRVAFVGDARRAVTASYDGTARVWDVATEQTLRTLETALYADVAIRADGARIAVGGDPAAVWDVETGARVATLATGSEDYGPLAFSPDGRRVAMAREGLAVRVWDAETGAVLADTPALDRTAEEPQAAWITPDGRLVVVHRLAGSRVVDLETGRMQDPAEPFLRDLYGLSYSADGTRAAVWRGVPSGTPVTEPLPAALTGETWPEAWGNGGVVEVWDGGADAPRLRLPLFAQARLSPDGRRLLATAYAEAAIWDMDGGVAAELAGHARQPSVGAFADGGRLLVADGAWDLGRGTWAPLPHADLTVAARDADRVLVTFEDGTAEVRRIGADRPLFALEPPYQLYDRPVLALAPDGARLAEADDRTVRVWDVDAGAVALTLAAHDDPIDHVAFTADGHRIVTRARDPGAPGAEPHATVHVWDAATGALLGTVRPPGRFGPDLTLSPDGARLATTADGTESGEDETIVWDIASGAEIARMTGTPGWLPDSDASFSPDGRRLLLSQGRELADGTWEAIGQIWDLETGTAAVEVGPLPAGLKVGQFSPDGRRLLTVDGDGLRIDRAGTATVWDAWTGAALYALGGYQGGGVESAAFSPDGAWVMTVGLDGTVQLWDAATGAEHAALFAFRDGTWAVVDPEGRYDASNGGDVDGLAWALDTPDGLEAVRLAQLKARYFDPGLLAKHLGFNAEPLRDVAAFRTRGVRLYPGAEVADVTPARAMLRLANRGGGIGAVQVFVNGTQVVADARPDGVDPASDSLTVAVDLGPFRRLFVPDTLNAVAVVAANAEGSLTSRRRAARVFVPAARGTDEEAPEADEAYAPRLWAILVGVGEYVGTELDLRFAGSDAADLAEALGVAAPRLFGAERTHVTLLTTEPGGDGLPTRAAIVDALAHVAAQADARDVLVVYLAGHGVVHGGADGDFYFLTSDASSGDLADAAVRQAVALSSADLEDGLAAVPAQKRVLILDTCASGRVVEQLSARRDVPGAQVRSLDRLKDHTGTFVLAGSAADAVSYEASQYGQGLLTWSLLEGMRLAADADDHAVDVLTWFDHAQRRVPELARSIGGIQQPELVMPTGRGSYPVGRVLGSDQARIPLQTPRPVVLRASFQDELTFGDPLGLTRAVNEALREVSVRGDRPPLVYVDAEGYPEAFRLAGRYAVAGDVARVEARLIRGGAVAGSLVAEGLASDPGALAAALVAEAEAALARQAP